ncbi:MAG: hypothetical protein NT129_06400 [Candidatus Aenigmarchaeota archaeon]|nr:hypothetical protein [Candidatus Aenigmarchaeota archaeon]
MRGITPVAVTIILLLITVIAGSAFFLSGTETTTTTTTTTIATTSTIVAVTTTTTIPATTTTIRLTTTTTPPSGGGGGGGGGSVTTTSTTTTTTIVPTTTTTSTTINTTSSTTTSTRPTTTTSATSTTTTTRTTTTSSTTTTTRATTTTTTSSTTTTTRATTTTTTSSTTTTTRATTTTTTSSTTTTTTRATTTTTTSSTTTTTRATTTTTTIPATGKYSGIGIHPSGHQFDYSPSYWVSATNFINSKISNTNKLNIWVTTVDWDDGSGGDECHITFPKPSGTYPHMSFEATDLNEAYLNAFDAAGIKVLLEIEAADANITDVINLILNRYSHHSSVAGISIDIEWIQPGAYTNGKAVTDAEASAWLTKIKSYNSSYMLNLVHWETGKMPPTFRDANLIIENDGEQNGNWNTMLSDFKAWGTHFSNANVGYMAGFDSDWGWIKNINDPAGTIINSVFNGISNCKVVYWAGWTIPDIFTLPTSTTTTTTTSTTTTIVNCPAETTYGACSCNAIGNKACTASDNPNHVISCDAYVSSICCYTYIQDCGSSGQTCSDGACIGGTTTTTIPSGMLRMNMKSYGNHNPTYDSRILTIKPKYVIDNPPHGLYGEMENPKYTATWLLQNVSGYQAAGIKVIGYITGGYEGKGGDDGYAAKWYSLATNKMLITNMATIDHVDGVFIDEVTDYPNTASKNYLKNLSDLAHSYGLIVWMNTGVDQFDEWYFTSGVADLMQSSEAWKKQSLSTVQKNWGSRISVTGFKSTYNAQTAYNYTIDAWCKGIAYAYINNVEYTGISPWFEEYAQMLRNYNGPCAS